MIVFLLFCLPRHSQLIPRSHRVALWQRMVSNLSAYKTQSLVSFQKLNLRCYSRFNGRPDLFGEHFPRAEDFAAAQDIIDDAFSFGEHLGRNIVEEIIFPMQRIWNSGTLNALPKTIEEAIIAFREEIEMVYQPSATRSVDWLKENGKCADNISPKQSTIEGAGRGAFATRDLPKGTIITGSPLHHIPIKDDFIHLFRTVPNDNPDEEPRSEVSGQQIQLNYCFGHAESTLLLCPCEYHVRSCR